MNHCTALIVEDDDGVQSLLKTILQKYCTSISVAADGAMAIEMLRRETYTVVLLDLMLPKVNGFAVAEVMQNLDVRPKLIVLSAIARYFTDRFPSDTIILQKPFDIDKLEDALRSLQLNAAPALSTREK